MLKEQTLVCLVASYVTVIVIRAVCELWLAFLRNMITFGGENSAIV